MAKAWKQDKKHNGTIPSTRPGPVEKELTKFPPMRGLCFGPYGETSKYVDQLILRCAHLQAERKWRSMGARCISEAAQVLVGRLRKRVGIMAVRTHADMKAARLRQNRQIGKAASRGAHRSAHCNHFNPNLSYAKGTEELRV